MRKYIFIIVLALYALPLFSQDEDAFSYKRNSLYPILVTFPQDRYSFEIVSEYDKIEIPDKYDDHRLSILKINADKKNLDSDDILEFLEKNNVARRMVARWFNRDKATGLFDTFLITKRGNYDANLIDVSQAAVQKRGNAILADAGDQLIENTFVVVHKISYVDKEKVAQIFSAAFQILGGMAGVVSMATSNSSGNVSSIADVTKSASQLGSTISDMIAGFTVNTTSHLYQLEWNDDVADVFYSGYWCDASYPEDSVAVRKERFEKEKDLFRLKYVGSYQAKSQKTVLRGLYENSDVIRKVCARALDKNVAELQRRYEVFRVKVPVVSLSEDGRTLTAPIGMKDGVSADSQYEVLEVSQDESGMTTYRRKGIVRPVKDRIWDNRYMAIEEEATGAELKGTTFEVVSGGGFYQGMLLREWTPRSSGRTSSVSAQTKKRSSSSSTANIKEESQPKRQEEVKQPEKVKQPEDTYRKADVRSAEQPKKSGSTMIMAVVGVDANNLGNFSTDRLSFGIQVGWAKKVGVYGKLKTNLVFTGGNGIIDSQTGWSTGNSKVSYMTATVGLMVKVIPQMYINVGGGYGKRVLQGYLMDPPSLLRQNQTSKKYGLLLVR